MTSYRLPLNADRVITNAMLFMPKRRPYVSVYATETNFAATATDGFTIGYDHIGTELKAGLDMHLDKDAAKELATWLRDAHFEPGSRKKAPFAVEVTESETLYKFRRLDQAEVLVHGVQKGDEVEQEQRRMRSLQALTLLEELRMRADTETGAGEFGLLGDLFGRFARVKSDDPVVRFHVMAEWSPMYVEKGSFSGAIMPIKPCDYEERDTQ